MISILLMLIPLQISGETRIRGEFSFPEPRGCAEGYWAGSSMAFYQRLLLSSGKWSAVILTEKDPGEDWGDLIAGGTGYHDPGGVTAAAGALRVQFARGLLLSNSGSWGSTDPLALSKPGSWRLRIEPAESPGLSDARPLIGAGALVPAGGFRLAAVFSRSGLDTGSSGLHRSPFEIESSGSVTRSLGAFRAGRGPVGLSFAAVSDETDSSRVSTACLGADLLLQGEEALLNAEFATDLDSVNNFVVSASRGGPGLRHGITVSRSFGELPGTWGGQGTEHLLGTGYGTRWKPRDHLALEAGVLYLRRTDDDRLRTGIQLTEIPGNRTEFGQRVSYTWTTGEETLSGRAFFRWTPSPGVTLSLKVPFSAYRGSGIGEEGFGTEARLRHRTGRRFEFGLSAAGCSTDGWNSRVYAYSLSFPGEFGSIAMYGKTFLLQASAMVNLSPEAVLRARGSWYFREGEEVLGSGWEETEGPSRTTLGVQLDWGFQ